MGWLARLGIFFSHIVKGAASDIPQLIILFLSIPCFKASDLFFKLAYRLDQRSLLGLRIRQGGLHGENLLVQLDGLFEDLRRVPQTSYSLR